MSRPYQVISIDVEANSLPGQIFAAAMTLSDAGGELDSVVYRCPIEGPVHQWVQENVLPVITDVEVTHPDYAGMLRDVAGTFEDWNDRGADSIAHVAWPLEARLLLDAFPGEDVWHGPYPLIDVSTLLLDRGFDSTSVDKYLLSQGIALPDGSAHNPLYDCRAAERAYFHLRTGGRRP